MARVRQIGPLVLAGLLAGASLAAQGPPPARYQAQGFTMHLTADGRYAFSNRTGELIAGAWRLEGRELVLVDHRGRVACPGQPGRYTWALSNDTLRFALVADPCQGRRTALAEPWIRQRGVLVLTGATLIDGTGGPPRAGITLVLEDGRIAAVRPDGSAPVPPEASVRDLRGHWVLPGLIDAHVHLATDPSGDDRRDRTERRLRQALLGGVVAVRDMAGDGRMLAALARDALTGDLLSPLIRYAAVMAGPTFFDDPRVRTSSAGVPPGTAPWARAVSDSSDLRQLVAEARGTGAVAIKLYADLTADLAARLAAEARRQGLAVWAHLVLVPARPSDVVTSGAQVVSHALFAAWEVAELPDYRQRPRVDLSITADHPALQRLFRLMREREVIFDPTLFVYRADSTLPDTAAARRREARAGEFVGAAHRAGVRIAAGTDGLVGDGEEAFPNIHTELRLLVERAGLAPMEALVAATRNAAAASGLEATHGTVEPGKAADLLVLRADPLADIRNTTAIAFVIRRGVVVER